MRYNTLFYLTFVSAVVAFLNVFDLQNPIVGPVAMKHLRQHVTYIRVGKSLLTYSSNSCEHTL